MKAILNLKKSIYYVAVLAAMVSMTSCSDDDDELTLTDVNGNYQGKMFVKDNLMKESESATSTFDLTAKVDAGKVTFEDFPVADIITAIEGEEAAEEILKEMEKVTYEIPFDSKLNAAQDSIYLTLKPEVLEFSYTKAASDAEVREGEEGEGEGEEEEGIEVTIKVTLKVNESGVNAYSDKKVLKLDLISSEVNVNDEPLEEYEEEFIRMELNKK